MRNIFAYIIFFIATIPGVFSQTGLNGVIKGTIKDKDGILEAATVAAGNKTVLSNHSGQYSISINPGIYNLTISFAGYQTIEKGITIKTCEIIELDFTLTPLEKMNDAVVLGSRSAIQRSNMNTPVPVDVISAKQLPIGQTDLSQQLFIVVPSFNAPPQTIGLGALTSPATLRGLGPDQTLVLVNGHRRHTTAYPFLLGGLGYGSVATDFNAIPTAAIETIDVLRDGAAAQYGSDAIAGIIDLQLKKNIGKTSVSLQTGEFSIGDGASLLFDINQGFRINKNGFINVTTDLRFRNYTQRNGEYDGTVYYNIPAGASPHISDSIRALDNQKIAERGFSRLNHRPIGNPKILNTGIVINGGYPFSKKLNVFWTGTLNYRFGDLRSSSVYRFPKDLTTVIPGLYPDGFLPDVANKYWDYSGIIGAEGKTSNNWHWDFSSIYGGNSQFLYVKKTNNATQFAEGKNAQTEFYSGNILFNQNTNDLNFSKDFTKYFHHIKSLTVSFGSEFRIDHFAIRPGEEASWQNYSFGSGRIGGAQGLPGFMPKDATSKSRYIMAEYGELEMDVNKKFLWNLAGRYEHYSDFGGNLAGKLAMRYKFSNRFMLRTAINNGFRAPSIQQEYFSSINQIIRFGQLFITGTFPNDDIIAKAFGIAPLSTEKSLNVSGGLTAKLSAHIDLTLDGYWIQIKDRIILTGLISRSIVPGRINQILDSINRQDINSVRFFTNAISTRTSGADLVLNGIWPFRNSTLEISLSANCNKTSIYKIVQPAKNLPNDSLYKDAMINREERGRIEHGQVGNKIIFTTGYKTSKWELGIRSVYYGKVEHLFPNPNLNPDEFFSGKTLAGLYIGYTIKPGVIFSIGSANIFNVYPDIIKNYSNTQNGYFIYDNNVNQIGFNGRHYFARMEFNWDKKKKLKAF